MEEMFGHRPRLRRWELAVTVSRKFPIEMISRHLLGLSLLGLERASQMCEFARQFSMPAIEPRRDGPGRTTENVRHLLIGELFKMFEQDRDPQFRRQPPNRRRHGL